MKLIDRSGGFWTNLIVRNSSNGDLSISQSLIPDERMMRVIGNEAISSIKGSVKHKIIAVVNNGKLVFNSSQNGTYPYGIFKRKTPDGDDYEPLADSTIRHRQWQAENGFLETNRGRAFILRQTGQHIVDGLHIQSITSGRNVAEVEVGWDGRDEKVALLQDKGGEATTQWFEKGEVTSEIPARNFRGFQEEFMNNFYSILDTVFE